MRLQISKSKNAASLYMVKSIYENGIRSTKVVEKLGTVAELKKKLNGRDPIEWAREYVARKTAEEKQGKKEIIARFSNSARITKDIQFMYNGGYLFLQDIYHLLNLDDICKEISKENKCEYNLNEILSRLVYTRVLYPSSKLSSYEASRNLIERPMFELHQIYRALDVIARKKDFIQTELYKNSKGIIKRNDKILFYDCTNFFFEIEEESGIKKYGKGKDHKPNPIVGMGLFMDGDGMPLAFDIMPGNTNEQITLKPLEKKIISDFGLSKFIVCTDAGLASAANRKYNDMGERAYITTQSVKQLNKTLKEWALNPEGWQIAGSDDSRYFNLSEIENPQIFYDKVFFKERAINDNGIDEQLIITFSFKYQGYQRKIRNSQIERAQKMIDTGSVKLKKKNQNDSGRFIQRINPSTGEVDEKVIYSIDEELIIKEEMYDGFYGVCTNLDDDASEIAKINKRRWEIEECFKIMKNEFKARPVHLQNDERIIAHFVTCFIALMIYRLIERKLDSEFTLSEITKTLRDMNFYKLVGEGYIPTYKRTDLTDALHDSFGFRTDTEIVDMTTMKNIIRKTKH